MTDRAYTVREIDGLRACCREMYLWGSYSGPSMYSTMSRQYKEQDMVFAVEEMVRTHMMAGLTAQDLKRED